LISRMCVEPSYFLKAPSLEFEFPLLHPVGGVNSPTISSSTSSSLRCLERATNIHSTYDKPFVGDLLEN